MCIRDRIRHVAIFPASHYIVSNEKKAEGLRRIRMEMDAQVEQFRAEGKLIEAPVSYTHLDVYKRQVLLSDGRTLFSAEKRR